MSISSMNTNHAKKISMSFINPIGLFLHTTFHPNQVTHEGQRHSNWYQNVEFGGFHHLAKFEHLNAGQDKSVSLGGGGRGGFRNDISQRWEWQITEKPESGGSGATEGPQWGPGATSLVGWVRTVL